MVTTTRKLHERDEAMAGDAMTATEAADALGVGPRRIRAMIDAGQLKATRHGERLWMIDRASVEAIIAQGGTRGAGRPRKERREGVPSVEVVLDQVAIERAGAAAMRGLSLVDDATGAVVSPQVVAFAAGLAAAKARRGVYRASEGADVSVDGGVYRVRLYGDTAPGQP